MDGENVDRAEQFNVDGGGQTARLTTCCLPHLPPAFLHFLLSEAFMKIPSCFLIQSTRNELMSVFCMGKRKLIVGVCCCCMLNISALGDQRAWCMAGGARNRY